MRFLADENLPEVAVDALRAAGFDIAWIRADAPGSSDDAVLGRARAEARVLLTFDKDFGEMVFRRGSTASCGIVLFRFPLLPPAALARSIVSIVQARSDWEGHFSVVELGRVRIRPLPA